MKKLLTVAIVTGLISMGAMATQSAFAWHGKLHLINQSKYTQDINLNPTHGNLWYSSNTCGASFQSEYKSDVTLAIPPNCTASFDMSTSDGQTQDLGRLVNDNYNCSFTIDNSNQGMLEAEESVHSIIGCTPDVTPYSDAGGWQTVDVTFKSDMPANKNPKPTPGHCVPWPACKGGFGP